MSLLNLSLSIAFRFLEIISLFKVVTGFFMLVSQVIRKWTEIALSSTRWSFKKTLFSGTIIQSRICIDAWVGVLIIWVSLTSEIYDFNDLTLKSFSES